MDNIKVLKKVTATLAFLSLMFAFIIITIMPSGIAFASEEKAYSLHNGVPVYADETLADVALELKQNQEVVVLETKEIDGKTYFKVTVNDITGYVNGNYIYTTGGAKEYVVKSMQIKADKVGNDVKVYATPSRDGKVIKEVSDGLSVDVIDTDTDFYLVVFDDSTGYVYKDNVTSGLSLNQTIALIVGVVTVATIIVILVLLYYRKNKEHFSARRRF